MSQIYRRYLEWRKKTRAAGPPGWPADDLTPEASFRKRGLPKRFLALVLAVGLLATVLLSDLPRALWQADGYAESNPAEASQNLDRIYSILEGSLDNPTTYDDYYQLASISIGKGEYEKAMEELDKCLELADEGDTAAFADVWTKKGSLYALQDQYAQAVQSLSKALESDPNARQALLLRAQIYIEQQKYAPAISDLEAYTRIMPDDTSPVSTLAQLYEATGKYDKARERYDWLYENDPADVVQRLNSLRCAFLLKEYQAALTGLDEYLGGAVREETAVEAADGTSDTASAVEEPTEVGGSMKATATPGGETAEPAEELPPQAAYAHYLRALCHMQLGSFGLAETDLTDALSQGYDEAMCYEQLTACDYALEKHDQVLAYGEKLIALGKSAAALDVLYQRMGVSAMTLEQTEKALEYLTQSLSLNAELAGSRYYRGLCNLTLEKYQEAIDDFTNSIEQNFLVQFCYYNRGVCYVQLQDYDRALSDMDKTLSSGDDQGLKDAAKKVLWQLAQYYENAKQQATGAAVDPAPQTTVLPDSKTSD